MQKALTRQRWITKLRIKGDSLRLRLTRPEVVRIGEAGRVEDTIHLAPQGLTYALVCDTAAGAPQVQHSAHQITVILPTEQVKTWAATDQVGIYASVDLGSGGLLELIVEKDFACIDQSDADNRDTFPNPKACS